MVRDKIPEIINNDVNNKAITSILNDEEYKKELNKKLLEEVNEYLEDDNVEELADIVEVVYGILYSKGVSIEDFEKIRFDYIVINNGAYIVDVNNNTINDLGCMDFEDAKKIDSLFSNKNAKVEYCTLNNYYKYYMPTNKNRSFEVKITQIEDVIEKIARINVILPSRQETNYYKKYIEENFNSLSVVAMEDTDQKNSMLWLTITDKNISKLIALSNLCEKLKINMKDVIFFGDGENDICLIKGAGLGIAMGNAIDLVKEQADIITLSNDEDGIYDFLKKIEE